MINERDAAQALLRIVDESNDLSAHEALEAILNAAARRKIEDDWVQLELENFGKFLYKKIEEKGNMSYVGAEEMRGAIDEEVEELHEAVHRGRIDEQVDELFDIMVAAFWGIVSIRQAGIGIRR